MKIKSLIYFICIVIFASCETEVNRINPVPNAPVSYSLNIMRDAPMLASPGNFLEITEPNKQGQYIGFSGLLIYHDIDGRFYAFDLCCPHEHKREIRVKGSMGFAECPECGSVYSLTFGSYGTPSKGPSEYPLKHYTVSRSGDYLRITK